MTDETESSEPQKTRKGLQIDVPGFEAEVSESTAKTFMDHTGSSWRWVVKAFAFAVFWAGFCWGLSWLI
jgi:anti-sigma-K factor RskA